MIQASPRADHSRPRKKVSPRTVGTESVETDQTLSAGSDESVGDCDGPPLPVPGGDRQNVDSVPECPTLIGTLGEPIGQEGEFSFRVTCPKCGRVNLHGWDPRREIPGVPHLKKSHCPCFRGVGHEYNVVVEHPNLLARRRAK